VFVRKLPAILAAAGLLVSLSACSGSAFGASCTPAYTGGGNAALVKAQGALGKDPNADFPTPLVAAKTPEEQVTRAGDGKVVQPGDTANIQITIYNGKTGASLISTNYTGTGLRLLAVKGSPSFGAIAQCATVGSRVAAVGTAGDLIGQGSIDQNKALNTLALTDTVVMVVDVTQSFLGRANGVDQLPVAGVPSIVLAPNGQPGFTFSAGDAPKDLKVATLKAGNGAAVKKGDSVVLNYTGVLWGAKSVFDSTWDRSAPATLTAVSLVDDSTGVVPGFATAIIGAKVGSQVLVVIPPKFGYPAGSAPSSVPDGSTMVFVIDILGIDKK
jgi:hypothetical protein